MYRLIQLLSRVIAKYRRITFSFWYSSAFARIGNNSVMFKPFRLDGSKNISIGTKTLMQKGTWLYCNGLNGTKANLIIGDYCVFGYNNHIVSVGEVIIGNSVLTANNVYISDNVHDYEDIEMPIMLQKVLFKGSVVIGEGSWLGENVCVIGANVGKNCVIGANAVVNKDIPDYSVAVGIPARVVKTYDHAQQKWMKV